MDFDGGMDWVRMIGMDWIDGWTLMEGWIGIE